MRTLPGSGRRRRLVERRLEVGGKRVRIGDGGPRRAGRRHHPRAQLANRALPHHGVFLGMRQSSESNSTFAVFSRWL
jgi:hypothetical protein